MSVLGESWCRLCLFCFCDFLSCDFRRVTWRMLCLWVWFGFARLGAVVQPPSPSPHETDRCPLSFVGLCWRCRRHVVVVVLVCRLSRRREGGSLRRSSLGANFSRAGSGAVDDGEGEEDEDEGQAAEDASLMFLTGLR